MHPLKIILFGSAARGEMGPDSDVDVMVVMPEGTNQVDTECSCIRGSSALPFGVDVIVATPEELEQHRRQRRIHLLQRR